MKKAYSYIRFSSPEQAKGRSQARQFEACQTYCTTHGLELALDEEYTFFDKGLSAYRAEHLGEKGQLKRFLDLVENGSIAAGSYLIVESLDRLSRERINAALSQFIAILNSGINIVTLSDGMLYKSDFAPQDLILSIFIMSRAHEESSLKAKRIGDAWKNKQELARTESKPIGAGIPLWLVLENGKYQLNPERSDVVRRVFDMAVNGFGKALIAKALNAEGIASFKNKTWGASSIDKILHNRAVLGEYQPYSNVTGKRIPRGDAITGYFPAVIDESTFYQAHAAIQGRKVAGTTKQSARFNLWQGICKCSLCEAAVHLVNKGTSPKGGTYLQCSNSRKGLCATKVVRLDKSELVFKEILVKVDSLSLVQDSSGALTRRLGEIEGRLAEQRTQLQDFRGALDRRYSQTVDDLAHSAEQEIDSLQSEKETLLSELAADRITNKEQFFAKLDIESYEGRYRANALLKRLKVRVLLNAKGKGEASYILMRGADILLGLHQTKEEIITAPFNADQMSKANTLDFDGSAMSAIQLLLKQNISELQSWDDDMFYAKTRAALDRAGIPTEDSEELKKIILGLFAGE